MIVLVNTGFLFGASLRWTKTFSEKEIKHIGSQTGGRILFFGGLLFLAFGIATLTGLAEHIPIDMGYIHIGLFMIIVAVPAFVYSVKEVLSARRRLSQDLSSFWDIKICPEYLFRIYFSVQISLFIDILHLTFINKF
ncbi:MAG: hypothetical protein P8184_02335 [Calditrichia bacterium]